MGKVNYKIKKIEGEDWYKFDSEYDRLKYFYGNIISVILLIILLFGGGFLTWYIASNLSDLKANPFTYGAEKMGGVQCSCSQDKGLDNYGTPRTARFYFNDSSFLPAGADGMPVKTVFLPTYSDVDFDKILNQGIYTNLTED